MLLCRMSSSKKRRRVIESSATDEEPDQSSVTSEINTTVELKVSFMFSFDVVCFVELCDHRLNSFNTKLYIQFSCVLTSLKIYGNIIHLVTFASQSTGLRFPTTMKV